ASGHQRRCAGAAPGCDQRDGSGATGESPAHQLRDPAADRGRPPLRRAAMPLRARLQSFFVKVWQQRGPVARLLYPLAFVHGLWRRFDVWRYRVGLARAQQMRVPVIVIGNLYVGGTGKTPLTIELT